MALDGGNVHVMKKLEDTVANVQLTVWSLKTTEDPGLNPVMGNLSSLYLLLTEYSEKKFRC